MAKELTLVQKLYLEALKDGPKNASALTTIIRDRIKAVACTGGM